MIAQTIRALRYTDKDTRNIKIAKGTYQYPRNLTELIRALKWLRLEK